MSRSSYVLIHLFFVLFLYSQPSEYQSLIIDKALVKHANSTLRKSVTTINVESRDKVTTEHTHVVTVYNSYGDRDVDAVLHYDENVSVKKLEAKIFNKLGDEIKKYKKNDFRDVSAVDGGTLYSDSRVYYLDYTPLEYPYTVEFTYETKNSSTAFVKPWFPIRNYYQSVESSRFEILDNSGSGIRHIKANLDFTEGITVDESPQRILCEAKNLPAIKYEDYSPSLNAYVPHVRFALSEFTLEGVAGQASNWHEMGKWQYEELLKGRDEVSKATRDEIMALTSGITDPLEKAKIVYRYVQDNTRYISVQVGIGGWQPILAEEVDEVRYGDCKGLTNYTKALLKIAGIDSNYTVVFAGSEKEDINKDFASMQGNHVILQVPIEGKNIWLECTNQDVPFGFIGSGTDDRNVLVINENGGKIERTLVYKPEDNYQSIASKIKISENGNISGNAKIVSYGTQFGRKFSFEKQSQKEVVKRYKNYYSHLKSLNIERFDFSRDDEDIKFEENFSFSAANYCSKFGNRYMFVPNVLNQVTPIPDKYRKRMTPFVITRGFFDEDEIEFSLPASLNIESYPEPIAIDSKFGSYSASFEVNSDGKLVYKRSMLLRDGEYPKEEYTDFRDFLISINKADQSKVILNSKT